MSAAAIVHATPAGGLRVRVADTFAARALGLLVGSELRHDEALLIAPCRSVHTFGMRYEIDVVFLDRARRVVRICANVRPGRVRVAWRAYATLELRAGGAERHGLVAGTKLADAGTSL